jgi:hypothetical protein
MAKRTDARPLRRTCGAPAAHMRLLETVPVFRTNQRRLEEETTRRCDARIDLATAKLVTIRVAVNVVYRAAAENVSQAQIDSQITALNKDFRATNPDRSQTPMPWVGLVTDARVQFKVARITRTVTTQPGFTHDDAVKSAAGGGVAAFEPKTHLNVWVCALTDQLLGYAQFPGGPAGTDGVVVDYRAFGTRGTALAPFHKGRTMTHEIGHYLNLRHIWGDTPDCSGSDAVADTPNCAGPHTGKPVWPVVSCNNGPNGDMFVNYMDYTDDEAMFMFTAQQVLRMRTALETTRKTLF